MSGTLYVVATPIGNLNDISFRAIKILEDVDYIAVENTGISQRLLDRYNINNKLIRYNEHNEFRKVEKIINHLSNNSNIALVTDAGTPSISDPGYRLVNAAHLNKINVIGIPGTSALINALSVSGLPTDHFYFEGFLPKKKGRITKLKLLATFNATIIIYESPQRIIKTLEQIQIHFGERIVCICREMTKIHEEIFRGSIWKVLNHYKDKASIKGEIVLLIAKRGYEE